MPSKRSVTRRPGMLPGILAQGFDASTYGEIPGAGQRRPVRVRCSQCQALAINGIPAHETGCPNQVHECRGCGNPVPRAGTYCEDCQ